MAAFSEKTVSDAWERAKGYCECKRERHDHDYKRCNKQLVWANRGRADRGAWEAHHIVADGPDIPSNCEILCWECHKNTGSFGR